MTQSVLNTFKKINIGKITKQEDQNLKEIGLDKKVLSYESTSLCNS